MITWNRAQTFVTIQFILLAVMVVGFLVLPASDSRLLRSIGIALMVEGVLVIFFAAYEHWARNRDIPNIVPTPKTSANLVTTGVYGRIRHPIYTGVISGAFGLALFHGNLLLIVLAVALLIFFWVKSRYEDELLTQAYPNYTPYKQRAGRFLPKLRSHDH